MIQSFLVQENEVLPPPPPPPPPECANELSHTHTHTHTHSLLSPLPEDGETANSVLYLGLHWEESKLNNVLIKSRAEW